jgi:hypothetical protein
VPLKVAGGTPGLFTLARGQPGTLLGAEARAPAGYIAFYRFLDELLYCFILVLSKIDV